MVTESLEVPDVLAAPLAVPSLLVLEDVRLATVDSRHPLAALRLDADGEQPRPEPVRGAGAPAGIELHESQPTDGTAATGDPVEGVDTVEPDQATRPSTEGVRR